MSYPPHKRSVSNYNPNNLLSINVNRSVNHLGTALTPNRISNYERINQGTPNTKMQRNSINFKPTDIIHDSKSSKFQYADIDRNRNSFTKTVLNAPLSSSNKKITDNINKKHLIFKSTTSNHTGLPTNFLDKYKEEKLKTNLTDNNDNVRNTPKKDYYSKSPILKRNSNNDSIMKIYEDLKNNQSISPTKRNNAKSSYEFKSNFTIKQNFTENKFKHQTEFREISTSPLLIKV
jgi:hypothetical protein